MVAGGGPGRDSSGSPALASRRHSATSAAPSITAAAPTWTVKPGGSITGTAPSAVVTDTTNGNKLSCRPAPA